MRANTEATIREETKARPPTSIRDHEVPFLKPGTATPPPVNCFKLDRDTVPTNVGGQQIVTSGYSPQTVWLRNLVAQVRQPQDAHQSAA